MMLMRLTSSQPSVRARWPEDKGYVATVTLDAVTVAWGDDEHPQGGFTALSHVEGKPAVPLHVTIEVGGRELKLHHAQAQALHELLTLLVGVA